MRGFRQPSRVYVADTDVTGRIHFSAPLRWAEQAELGLFRKLGVLELGHVGDLPRRHLEVEFLRKLSFDDEVVTHLWIDRIGTSSVTFRWDVFHDDELAVSGHHTVVNIGPDGRPAPLPDVVRERFELDASAPA